MSTKKLTKRQIYRNWRLIRAFRSEKYKQTVGHLSIKNDHGVYYCAQGVGCELSKLDKWGKWLDGNIRLYKSNSTWAPPAVVDYYGWSVDFLYVIASWNDGGYTFLEIADKLEEWLINEINKTEPE